MGNPISLYESWIWESDHEDLDETPLFSDLGAISAYTSLEYPTLLHTNMTTNESHRGIIGISKSFSVKAESELVLLKNSKVDILNGSELTVESGATLTIGKYVEFTNGKIIIEDGATVNIDTDLTLDHTEILLYNSSLSVSSANLDNQSSFWLHGSGTYEITYSDFSNGSKIMGVNNQGSVLVDNCEFDDSYVHIENNNFAPSILATISDCDFANSNNYTAIRVEGCNTYNIDNNTIDNYMYGIEVWNSGHEKEIIL
ncbi:hypothetical protein HNS38_20025 [Lentimicrobium sp. L6]|uniref:hypothetical protein n=1 Tax=Lentimicrobium sp. L6 TaxID=2735916 RepID=UPI001552C98E|nr:hypothetical protein [Lentimicrobium sp. L6]NPD87044.1 hypothetical protein [Lentimicrobium sp. L6]